MGEVPRIRVGSGPPLVYLPGLSPQNGLPPAWDRFLEVQSLRSLTPSRTVHWMGRRRGLPIGTTMADLASDQATAMRAIFDVPVDVLGASTGGSLAQQLAADHPDVVARLALVCTGCRLGPAGVELYQRVVASIRAGDVAQAYARLAAGLVPRGPVGWLAGAAGGAGGPRAYPHAGELSDLAAVMLAECAFDLCAGEHRITAPTLLVAGDRDRFYDRDLLEQTVTCCTDGRLRMYAHRGHVTVLIDRRFGPDVLGFIGGRSADTG